MKRWRDFVNKLNSKGIPAPMMRDPKNGRASVSLTLVFISFNFWMISVVGKAAGAFGGIDPQQTFNMVMLCFGLYFGRKFQKPTPTEVGKSDEQLQSQ